MMKRRSFMKGLFGAPFAAKAAAKEALAQTGFDPMANSPTGLFLDLDTSDQALSASANVMAIIEEDERKKYKLLRKLANHFRKTNELPPWKEFEIKRSAMEFRGLDGDLASMRSLSLTHKIRIQRNRNIEVLRAESIRGITLSSERAAWFAKQREKGIRHIDWY